MRQAHAPRARIHLTGTGGWGILTCLAIAAAAANTANNLLYLLLALLLSAYATSAWMSRRILLGVEGDLVAPQEMRRDRPVEAIATLHAGASRAPGVVLALHAIDRGGREAGAPSCRALPLIPRRGSVSVPLEASFPRRGPARLRLMARSPFPFGLIEGLRLLAEQEVLVLPDPDPSWRRPVGDSLADGEAAPRKGEGTDIFNIRNYAWGEDARRMDWKATARLGRPMLREHAAETQASVAIVLPGLRADRPEETERAISRAAGAAEDLDREGWRLRLLAPGVDARGDARTILRELARLEAGRELPDGWWRQAVAPGESALILSGEAQA